MKTYTIRCERDEARWWVATVPELPAAVTQARRLDQIESRVAEVVQMLTGKDRGDYTLAWDVKLPRTVSQAVARARKQREVALATEAAAAASTADAANLLMGAGLTTRDAGRLLGLTHQRIAQIVKRVDTGPGHAARKKRAPA